MPADDVNKRRAIINIFVHSIYLYDDNFTLIINASKKPLSIDNIPLDDIEAALSGDTYTSAKCSSMKLSAPPFINTESVILRNAPHSGYLPAMGRMAFFVGWMDLTEEVCKKI